MPVLSYDYDDYEYRNGRRVTPVARQSSNENTSTRTRQATRDQVRMIMQERPEKVEKIEKVEKAKKVVTSTKAKQVEKESELEIPTMRPRQNGQKMVKPEEMKLQKPELSKVEKVEARERAVRRVNAVCYLIVAFAIAFFVCYRYSLINERFNEIEQKKKELATAQTVNEQIQADIDSQTDLAYIENYAKYQLGMQKPSNSQIVYVNNEREDRILTPVTMKEEAEKTWFEKCYDELVHLFETNG